MTEVDFPKEEKAEFEAVLNSGIFDRTHNLARILKYLGEKYFSGAGCEIKEYSIAVEALNRPASFDPKQDAVVRVSMHSIRKRLEEYYADTGSSHSLKLSFPVGRYTPAFVRVDIGEAPQPNPSSVSIFSPQRTRRILAIIAVVVVSISTLAALRSVRNHSISLQGSPSPLSGLDVEPKVPPSNSSIRILAGASAGFTDSSGHLWLPDKAFIQGGGVFHSGSVPILGTSEPQLFRHGRSGRFQLMIPMLPGRYELHLYFAETLGFAGSERQVIYSLNGQQQAWLDVYDDAGGANVATMKITPDVKPESDGAIHLEFKSVDSFVNAIEIVPNPNSTPLPLRIVTGPASVEDERGVHWESDNWYFGGTDVERVPHIQGAGPLYRWERYGNFRYNLPVAADHLYTVRLFFSEGYFGTSKRPNAQPGYRVFDVYCNGQTLLRNFDLAVDPAAHERTVVKTFEHLQPTASGKLMIDFVSVRNFAQVDAIEVTPEAKHN